ncbi:hypothetical protein POF50_031550 [Streptomyces sp. SL13]|uniref:SMI1/KNR4 family protein n=1 Tax=Streptantibioticus silvisoli TaxID=2705255 RepID=A0AA90H5C5_9ACTN|nr:hypothetical protein [Streptantibioticus silvisoli]MDI5973824.1 hypothetical protein [Streptantibioticus silvisoli]
MAEENEGTRAGRAVARWLASTGRVTFAPGLTAAELTAAEERWGFTFADDHRGFLSEGLAVDGEGTDRPRWPDWRHGDPADLRRRLEQPVDGVLFDVRHGFWTSAWGERPPSAGAAEATARRALASGAAKLVPVYGHRYLPAGRGTSGHPVLSVHQTDVIVYGGALSDWAAAEFGPAADDAVGGVRAGAGGAGAHGSGAVPDGRAGAGQGSGSGAGPDGAAGVGADRSGAGQGSGAGAGQGSGAGAGRGSGTAGGRRSRPGDVPPPVTAAFWRDLTG